MAITRTNLERDAGNTEDGLCNWIRLEGVNVLLVLCRRGSTDPYEDSAIFKRRVHRLLYRSAHQWGVFF